MARRHSSSDTYGIPHKIGDFSWDCGIGHMIYYNNDVILIYYSPKSQNSLFTVHRQILTSRHSNQNWISHSMNGYESGLRFTKNEKVFKNKANGIRLPVKSDKNTLHWAVNEWVITWRSKVFLCCNHKPHAEWSKQTATNTHQQRVRDNRFVWCSLLAYSILSRINDQSNEFRFVIIWSNNPKLESRNSYVKVMM